MRPRRLLRSILFVLAFTGVVYAQLSLTDDAYTSSGTPKKTFGPDPLLFVQGSPGTNTYLRFTLAPLPAGYSILNVKRATLRLFVAGVTSNGSFDVVRVTGPWSEGAITFNN